LLRFINRESRLLISNLTFFLTIIAAVMAVFPFIPYLARRSDSRVIGFWFFLPLLGPQLIDEITRVRATSFESGDPKSSLLTIIASLGPCIFLEILAVRGNFESRSNPLSAGFFFNFYTFCFFSLSLLSIISAITNPKPFVPTFGAISFLYLILFVLRFRLDIQMWLQGVFNFGFLISGSCLLLGILHFPWMLSRAVADQQYEIYLENTYISPFNDLLGFPARVGLFFNDGPQASAIFFGTLVVLMLSVDRIRFRVFGTGLAFIDGSLTGSRTFYLMVLIGLALKLMAKFSGHSIVWNHPFFRIALGGSMFLVAQNLASEIIPNYDNVKSYSGRTEIWALVLNHWQDKGIFGHGMNTLKPYVAALHWSFAFEHAHNSIMQWLWDFGLLGFALSVGCYISILFVWFPSSLGGSTFNGTFSIVSLPLLSAITEVTLNLNAMSPLCMGWIALLMMMGNPVDKKSDSVNFGSQSDDRAHFSN